MRFDSGARGVRPRHINLLTYAVASVSGLFTLIYGAAAFAVAFAYSSTSPHGSDPLGPHHSEPWATGGGAKNARRANGARTIGAPRIVTPTTHKRSGRTSDRAAKYHA